MFDQPNWAQSGCVLSVTSAYSAALLIKTLYVAGAAIVIRRIGSKEIRHREGVIERFPWRFFFPSPNRTLRSLRMRIYRGRALEHH